MKMMRYVLALLVFLIVSAACGLLEADPFTDTVPAIEQRDPLRPEETDTTNHGEITADPKNLDREIADFVEAVMAEDGLPGAAVAVVSQDAILFAEGFGYRDVENKLPVTPETLFHIGSTNKSITALLIATLVDQGLFGWDTPVVEIYPDFELSSDEATATVTMRHLLGMQSGIPDDAEDDFDSETASGEDVFAFVRSVPLLGLPGEEFSYSNISASLAGYLGVMAAGADYPDLYTGYEQLLEQQVLNPIGMKTAVLRVSEAENNPDYGKSYVVESGKAVEAEREDYDGDPLAPSGALKANVIEMAAYIRTQLNRGQAPNGVRVVSAENLLETWQPGLEDYALGWEISEYAGVEVLSHEGAFDHYLSVIGFVPELNIGFVILTNSEEAGEGLIEEGPIFLIELMLDS